MKKTMKVMKVTMILLGIWIVFLFCDVSANYIRYRNNGFDQKMAEKWAFDETERNWIKPITDWCNKYSKKESEIISYPMVIQSIQGNTLVNEFKSGR